MANAKEIERQLRLSFQTYYDKACSTILAERHQDPRRTFFLRPSSFPYCGLRRFLDWPKVLEEEGRSYMDTGMLFYVTVGIAFHNIFQEVLGKQGQLIGNWKCPACKNVKLFTTYSRCKSCDEPRKYQELKVTFKKTLLGHIDGIYFDEKTKTYWVIDYKSTSSKSVWFHTKKRSNKFPYSANVSQISAYVPLVEKIYGIKVSGYLLVYIPRDNPMDTKVLCAKRLGPKAKDRELNRLKHYVKVHRRVLISKQKEDLDWLYDNKLCESKQDYENNHHSKHSPCPHVGYCFKKPKMISVLTDTLNKKMYPILKHAPEAIKQELAL